MDSKQIGFVGFKGVAASHLVSPADAFAAATLDVGYGDRIFCYRICVIGLTREPFQSESGIVVNPQETLETAPDLDTIIIPGGQGLSEGNISDAISEWILTRARQTRRIVAVSTGIYGLAPTGLLDGREVTTSSRLAGDVIRRFPQLRVNHHRPIVKDGPFYTSSNLTSAIDLAFALIEEDYGKHVALAAARNFMIPFGRNEETGFCRPAKFDSQPIDRFGELIAWIMQNLQEDLSVTVLARKVCMSPTHFNRAFKSVFGSTPTDFVENLRLNEARRRLSVPKRTLDTVAASVGFSNSDAFRRAFTRRFGAKPRNYLNNFDLNVSAVLSKGK